MGNASGLARSDEVQCHIVDMRFLAEQGEELLGLNGQCALLPSQPVSESDVMNRVLCHIESHTIVLRLLGPALPYRLGSRE
jgi:hypothetical protein